MRVPRVRVRTLMIAVLAVAVLMFGGAEEIHRRERAGAHTREAQVCFQESREAHRKGMAELAKGHKPEAARCFASANYWNGRGNGHEHMARTLRRPPWSLLP